MSIDISSIAYAVRTATDGLPFPIKLGQAQQCVAAALGYKSLAALQAVGNHREALPGDIHIIIDSQKMMARSQSLGLPYDEQTLVSIVTQAFAQKIPRARFHPDISSLENALHNAVEGFVVNHPETAGQIGMANHRGLSEVYLPFDIDLGAIPGSPDGLDLPLQGKISLTIDPERPYAGHRVDVKVALWLTRQGRNVYAFCLHLDSAVLRRGTGQEDEDEPPKVSRAEALAELLHLSLDEAEQLVDVEPIELDSHNDAHYGYVFDFSEVAADEGVQRKILQRHGSLRVTVGPNFFERVHHLDPIRRRYYVHGDQSELNPAEYFCAHCDRFVGDAHFEAEHPGRAEERYFLSLASWRNRPMHSKIGYRRPEAAANVLAVPAMAKRAAREASRSDFHRWLARQAKRNDSVGDLARDAAGDRDFPVSETHVDRLRRYLELAGASGPAMNAFEEAWCEFCEDPKRKSAT